jgi:tetratricopeptide (TPR) repeat protein
MNAESYVELLKQHANLYQLPYEALKSLAMQYPYSQSLQLLFLIKNEMEDHPDRSVQLQKAALYAPDRKKLYRLLKEMAEKKQQTGDAFHLKEEFLELKDLAAVAADLEKIALVPEVPAAPTLAIETPIPTKMPTTATEIPDDSVPKSSIDPFPIAPIFPKIPEKRVEPVMEIVEPLASPTVTEPEKEEQLTVHEPPIASPVLALLDHTSLTKSATIAPIANATPVFKPLPKSAFSSWANQFPADQQKPNLATWPETPELNEARERIKTKKNKDHDLASSEAEVIEFAQKSIELKNTFVTETLAELLVNQEKYPKAIAVYERLILLFPEKSARFAAKIDSIKKLLS